VQATAYKVVWTQKANVPVDSGETRDSIMASAPDGHAFKPTTTEAEVGPTWFVGRFIETGTVLHGPRVYVANSMEPHRAQFEADMLEAGSASLSDLTR
jgi:hypothetical protein